LSFDLHDQLAQEHNGAEKWGYRRVDCGQLNAVGFQPTSSLTELPSSNSNVLLGKWWNSGQPDSSDLPDNLDWINTESIRAYEELADKQSTAQVHPLQFTNYMAKLAEQSGAKIVMGTVEHINCIDTENISGNSRPLSSVQDPARNKVVSITYTDKATAELCNIPATIVVLAAGPWTPTLFPAVHMSPVRAHSITIKLKEPVSAYCLFTTISLTRHHQSPVFQNVSKPPFTKTISAEIYARPNNEVYICSQGDFDVPLPPPTDTVIVSTESCREITEAASSVSQLLQNGQVTGRRACYLPTMDAKAGAGPLVGPTGLEGLLLATGHSCWGVSNAPATGRVISEFIFDGEVSSAKIGNLDPRELLYKDSGIAVTNT